MMSVKMILAITTRMTICKNDDDDDMEEAKAGRGKDKIVFPPSCVLFSPG